MLKFAERLPTAERRRLELAQTLLKELEHVPPGTAYDRALDDYPLSSERQLHLALQTFIAQNI